MPYAQACACLKPLVFANEPDTCQRCGRGVPVVVVPSTDRVIASIAEVAIGQRRMPKVN